MSQPQTRVCPGCGGRNSPHAEVCDWCARPFSGPRRSLSFRWWQIVSSVLFGLLVVAVVGLAILNANSPEIRPRPSPSPNGADLLAASRPAGAPAATPIVVTPRPSPPTATPTSEPTPVPTPAPRYARVVNTGGAGVNLRREPGQQGQPVVAVPENTVLRLVGPEQAVQARLWRLCEYQPRGVQGWVPAEYLQALDGDQAPPRG